MRDRADDRYYGGGRRRSGDEQSFRGGGDSYRPAPRNSDAGRFSPPRGPARYYDRDIPREPRRWEDDSRRDNRREYDRYEPLQYDRNTREDGRTSRGRTEDRFPDQPASSGYQKPGESSGSESESKKTAPAKDIKISGLLDEVTESEVRFPWPTNLVKEDLIQSYGFRNIADVRIIKDKIHGISRGFGFISFTTVEDATNFMEKFPRELFLHYPPANPKGHGFTMRVDYSRESVDRSKHDWACPDCSATNFSWRMQCHKCQTPKPAKLIPPKHFQRPDGSVHVQRAASCPLLVIHGLPANVDETLLANGVSKLLRIPNAPSNGSGVKGPTKLMSTATVRTRGAKEGSLHRVFLVRDRETAESWRYGFAEFFSTKDAEDAIAKYESSQEFTIGSKPVEVHFSNQPFQPMEDPAMEETFAFPSMVDKDRLLVYCQPKAFATPKVVKEAPQPAPPPPPPKDSAPALAPVKSGDKTSSKKRKAESGPDGPAKKPQLLQWMAKHAEIHEDDTIMTDATTDTAAIPGLFLDEKKLCCMLCSRKFKDMDKLIEHERDSELHRDNLKDEKKKTSALTKLGRTLPPANSSAPTTTEDPPKYFDRAKARRKEAKEERRAERKTAAKPSFGEGLLAKYGWSAGQGIGASSSGITAPIETSMYAPGVGLGKEGGRIGDAIEEANKNTKDSGRQYIERTKENARARFEQMQKDSG